MSFTVKSATWGDDTSATDITDVIKQKASKGYLDVKASQDLMPYSTLISSSSANLDDKDKADALEMAQKDCSGGSDKTCVDTRKAYYQSTILQKKIADRNSSANTIVGRKMTVTIIDPFGEEHVLQVAEGQDLKIGKVPASAAPSSFQMPSFLGTVTTGAGLLFWPVLVLGYAFFLFATWRLMIQSDHTKLAYVFTGLNIFLPPSGFLATLVVLAYDAYQANKVSAPV